MAIAIQVGDIVNVTLVGGVMLHYEVTDVPGPSDSGYWSLLSREGTVAVVGPALLAMEVVDTT